jgi:hypothetical protein
MIVVGKKLLCVLQDKPRLKVIGALPQFKVYEPEDAETFWLANQQTLKTVDSTLKESDVENIRTLFFAWALAPVNVAEKNHYSFFFSPVPLKGKEAPIYESALQSTQFKKFNNVQEMFCALIGHYRAAEGRKQEERLSLQVLNSFESYEKTVVDPLIQQIAMYPREGLRSTVYPKKESRYGIAATVDWDLSNPLTSVDGGAPLERLYKKIAALHDFASFVGVSTPGRDDHKDERMGQEKYSLNENNSQIIDSRSRGISVWAGKSGSTMDIMYVATLLGLDDPQAQTVLAYCIAAFFHMMPTNRSSTHTFHEVMRGAQTVCPGITYDHKNAEIPSSPPLAPAKTPVFKTVRKAPKPMKETSVLFLSKL